MKVSKTTYSGWNNYPTYTVNKFQDYLDLIGWMNDNDVKHFLLSSGIHGYTFQVRSNAEWFELKWA